MNVSSLRSFTVVWQKREYRACFLIMVMLSLAISSTLPLLTLYLVNNLHVALSRAGLFFVGEALPGLVIGLVVGRLSDRWVSRLPAMRFACVWVAIGWGIVAFSPDFWLTVAAGAFFLSSGGITFGQTFAVLHDVMVRDREARQGLVNTTVRTAFSLGFVVGPLIGSELATLTGFRTAFLFAGALNLLCLAPLKGLDVRVSSSPEGDERNSQGGSSPLLYIFVGLCVLVLTGTALRVTYLPIDVTKHLGASLTVYGTVMAVSPVAELLTMPAAGLLSLRFSLGRLLTIGLTIATVEYLILALNTALWEVYLTQAMDALVVAVLFGLGMTYAQQLSPDRAGFASSAFGSAFGMSTLVGNLVGSVSVPHLGVPHIFFIPLFTSAAGLVTFIAVDRAARGRSAVPLPSP